MSGGSKRSARRPSLWTRLSGQGGRGRRGRARRLDQPWVKRALLGGAGLLGLAALLGAGAWTVQSGALARAVAATQTAALDATADAGLALREVYVAGRKETDRAQLLEALEVEIGAPILALDPEILRAKVEALGWVATAQVERRLPDTLVVRIAEREAAAIWQRDGEFVLIDRAGAVIGSQDVDRRRHLKVLVGPGAHKKAAELLDILDSEPALKARLLAAVWMSERRWNLRFDHGVDVRLPEDDPAGGWRRLAQLERDHAVLSRAVTAVDLRQPDRVIARLTPDGALQLRARTTGEET